MGLDVYFRRDIANVLRATACASEGAAQEGATSDEYRRGVRNTLLSVGLAFGLEPVRANVQQGQGASGLASGLAGLLWAESPDRG